MNLWKALNDFIAELIGIEQFDEENPETDTSRGWYQQFEKFLQSDKMPLE